METIIEGKAYVALGVSSFPVACNFSNLSSSTFVAFYFFDPIFGLDRVLRNGSSFWELFLNSVIVISLHVDLLAILNLVKTGFSNLE